MALCARGGCTGTAERTYCSKRCASLARILAGWRPQLSLLRPDVRKKACRNGALACAAMARRRRAKAIRERIASLLGHRVFEGLDAEQRAAVIALIGRGYRLGKADGYQRGWHAKDTPRLKRKQQKGAAA